MSKQIPLLHRMAFSDEEMERRAADFYEEIRRRRTVRDFDKRPVPRVIIDHCLRAAGTAPSGANHQPWHFAVVGDPALKSQIRKAAEEEERTFYGGRAGAEWLADLEPLGTNAEKPFLEQAPWLIVIFGQRSSVENGKLRKNYYVPESVSIATGFLVAALHHAGLATLTHTPSPMGFLTDILGRPRNEKPYILLVVGHPAQAAKVPEYATRKKSFSEIVSYQ
ncbi:nitroreductase family protein [Rhizobium leguminosarum]|uniref:nitroreductase family protein n=1 Tax=Rhizobium TaxID=379 RepID=UPI001030EA29|nr:nitroreductase family protein [Rhizobium leguminosarum]TBF87879.1 nitroreductase family protein [Rhizobium leguminosarum]TBG07140.1 nitroreductase family protein [Rhizobium leguminosarum]TBG07704.1 nitroreductase family protein [Rhizobium leguminosarum]TBG30824.1 nitroreductase family protein [Rhizobium leguminosarum]TBG50070.1 nitroreductase family protein [Rhizobium leguminosarum]